MDARSKAEHDRLDRAWRYGPGRRMIADAAEGRDLARADVDQSDRYRRLMDALTQGRT
jgi:hypothetical protein